MASIYTRFGTPVRIVGRCADWRDDNENIHAVAEDDPARTYAAPLWEFRASGGLRELTAQALATPLLECSHPV